MYLKTYLISLPVRPWLIFIVGLVVFIGSLNYESNGDIIYYANIIDTLSFDRLTAHQAYYLLGYLFKLIFFGYSTDQALAWMSAIFGAGSLSIGYLLLKQYLDSDRDALLGVIMLLVCHRFFANSTSAEIYMVQSFFLWSSYLLFERRNFYTAGFAIAMALWVTPLSVAYVLVFPVVAWLKAYGVWPLFRMALPVALVYIPFLHFCYRELFWGVRGLLDQDARREVMLIPAAKNFFIYQFKHYSFLNVLIFPALVAIRRYRHIFMVTIAAALPNLYVISQLRGEDNVFILGLDIFIVCWFVIGWRYLRERSLGFVAVLLLVMHIAVFVVTDRPFLNPSHKNYKQEMQEIYKFVQTDDDPVLLMDWARRMAFVYFNRESATYPLEEGELYYLTYDLSRLIDDERKDMENDEGITFELSDFDDYSEIYVLETYEESPQARIFLDEATLEQRFEINSKQRRAERFLDSECTEVRPGMFRLYRCR